MLAAGLATNIKKRKKKNLLLFIEIKISVIIVLPVYLKIKNNTRG